MTRFLDTVLQWGPHYPPHDPMGPHWGAGGMVPGGETAVSQGWVGWPVIGLLLVAIVVLGILYLFRSVTTEGSDRAMTVLRKSYASGELTDEEFERRLARLSGRRDT